MRVVAIDPGLASMGIVLMEGNLLVDFAEFETKPTHETGNADAYIRAGQMCDLVFEFLNRNEPVDHIVIEEFITRSGQNYSAAWTCPYMIGFLSSALMMNDYEFSFRSPAKLPDHKVRERAWSNYKKVYRGLDEIERSLSKTRREHVICAALHAIGYMGSPHKQKRTAR